MIALQRDGVRASVAEMGGELTEWSVDGRELLWSADAAWWGQSAPVLFPIVGWARDGMIRVDGVERPMGVHGFAAARRFRLVERDATSCRLELVYDEATRAIYPFAFRLTVTYALTDAGLAVRFEVMNRGERPMPYALGFHPGFRWPFAATDRAGHAIGFGEAEEPSVPVIAPGGLFSTERRHIPLQGRRLALDETTFAAEALCFLDARSHSLGFEAPDGSAITMALEGFPHIALWSRPGAPFLCMEAWTGHGDPVGFAGELADKPSMRLIAPGASEEAAVLLSYADGRPR